MADEPNRKKRRIRPASSETLRERTDKAQAKQVASAEPKPKRLTGVRAVVRGFFTPILFVLRPVFWLLRHIIPRYFKNSWKELRQVTWPSGKQSRQLTSAVMVFAIVFALFISALDYGLDKVFKRILLK